MENSNILISGGGIAGLTLAYWLKEYGFNPTVIEISPKMREGGYMIDFWGVGFTVAEKMNILKKLENEQNKYKIDGINFVNENNKKIGGLKISKIRELVNYKYFNLLRSSLEKVLYNEIKDKVEIRFSTTISEIKQNEEKVLVSYENGESETFDLVIGADGLRSNVRRLVYGPDTEFELFLNYYTSAYTIDNFTKKDNLFLSFTIPKRQVGIYDVGKNKLATFYIYFDDEHYGHLSDDEKKQKLINTFKNVKWYVPEILKRINQTDDFYFDRVSQIELPKWDRGRIALVGDASHAVSLISGQGSSLSMASAYTLAGELKAFNGDYQKAFQSFQNIMKPEIMRKQKSARKFAGSFVPSNKLGIFFRNLTTKFLFIPIISKYVTNLFLDDKLQLKDY